MAEEGGRDREGKRRKEKEKKKERRRRSGRTEKGVERESGRGAVAFICFPCPA